VVCVKEVGTVQWGKDGGGEEENKEEKRRKMLGTERKGEL
jgi:hypothetical protein